MASLDSKQLTVVTGFQGFIANKFLELAPSGTCILGVGRSVSKYLKSAKEIYEFPTHDLPNQLAKLSLDHETAQIVHLATHYSKKNDLDTLDSLIESNLRFPLELMTLIMKSLQITKFVNLASFFEQRLGTYNNSKPNLYAESKTAFASIARELCKVHQIPWLELVIYDVFSTESERHKILDLLIRHSFTNSALSLGNPDSSINISRRSDVAESIWLAKESLVGQYSIHSQSEYKLEDLPRMVSEKMNQQLPKLRIVWDDSSTVNRPSYLVPLVPGHRESLSLEQMIEIRLNIKARKQL